MKLIITLITLLSIQIVAAQNTFQKGYFVNNSGKRTECLIKNMGWRSNPTEFKWKTSEEAEIKTATIKNIQEFGITNALIYPRYTIDFDLSPININNLEKGRGIKKSTKTIFLKTLIGSKEASLYVYQKNDIRKYFYKTELMDIPEVLVYKKYLIDDNLGNKNIGENNDYRYQLKTNFSCDDQTSKIAKYEKNALVKYFNNYLSCKNIATDHNPKSSRFKTEIGVIGGVNFSSFNHKIFFPRTTLNSVLENTTSARLGAYLEEHLPFYNNKLSAFIEVSYLSFNTENKNPEETLTGRTLNYKSIDLYAGAKFYFFLKPKSTNEKVKLYIESGIVLPFNNGSRLEPSLLTKKEDINPSVTFAAGLGIKYKRYSLFYRNYTSIDMLKNYLSRTSDLKIQTIGLSVAIFN